MAAGQHGTYGHQLGSDGNWAASEMWVVAGDTDSGDTDSCWAMMEAAVVICGCWSAMEVAAVTVHEQCKLNTCGQVWCLVVVQQQAGVRVVMEAAVEETVSVFPIVSPSTCQGARCWR